MAESEFIRQKREREFQARVLVAVEKPKHGRLWAALNSRFFSLVVIGLFATSISGYFTHYQQCVTEANKDGDKYVRLGAELSLRHGFIATMVADAKDIGEITTGLSRASGFRAEFKETRLEELSEERQSFVRKIDFGAVSGLLQRRQERFLIERNQLYSQGINPDSIDYAFSGIISKPFSNETLENVQRYTKLAFNDSPEKFLDDFRLVEANCSLTTIFKGILGFPKKTLKALYHEYTMQPDSQAPPTRVVGPPYAGRTIHVYSLDE